MRISDWSSDVCSSDLVAAQQVDVSSEAQIVAAFDEVMKQFGRIDTVIANAGPPPSSQSSLTLSSDDYLKFIDVALHGAYYTLREGARRMVQRAEAGDMGGSLIACGSTSMRAEEHTTEPQSLMRISYAVFCLKTKNI